MAYGFVRSVDKERAIGIIDRALDGPVYFVARPGAELPAEGANVTFDVCDMAVNLRIENAPKTEVVRG